MQKIILASSSPRRQELFNKLGVPFECIPSSYEEDMTQDLPPEELVQELALGKALDVFECYPDATVVGADTVVLFGGKVQGKPRDEAHAREILRAYAGTCGSIITGVAVVSADRHEKRVSSGRVCLKSLTDEEIEAYVATGDPLDKAGAFAIQWEGGKLIERIEGDMDTLLGLPVEDVRAMLSSGIVNP